MIVTRGKDAALSFHRRLRVGIDADYTKSNPERRAYHKLRRAGTFLPAIFKARGFDHIRLRVANYDLTTVLPLPDSGMSLADEIVTIVKDCNSAGIAAIVAFQAEDWKTTPGAAETARVVAWWQVMATKLIGLDCAFNLIIETTLIGNTNTAALNDLYKKCAEAIVAIDPSRVMICCPQRISDPFELPALVVPAGNFFVESHFYAAGPSPTSAAKLWTTGTPAEKKLITDKIDAMVSWRETSGYQVWVGAIMWADYNSDSGNDLTSSYSMAEQINIATFTLGKLKAAGIPVAINATGKYYDSSVPGWIAGMSTLVDSFFTGYA